MHYRFVWAKKAQDKSVDPTIIQKLTTVVSSPGFKRIAIGGGIGAAVGGAGLGLANLYRKHDESDKARRKRIRDAAVIGSLLGGTAGGTLASFRPVQYGPKPVAPPVGSLTDRALILADKIPAPALGALGGLGYAAYKSPVNPEVYAGILDKELKAVTQRAPSQIIKGKKIDIKKVTPRMQQLGQQIKGLSGATRIGRQMAAYRTVMLEPGLVKSYKYLWIPLLTALALKIGKDKIYTPMVHPIAGTK